MWGGEGLGLGGGGVGGGVGKAEITQIANFSNCLVVLLRNNPVVRPCFALYSCSSQPKLYTVTVHNTLCPVCIFFV